MTLKIGLWGFGVLVYRNEALTQIFSETQTSEPDQNHVSDPILRALELGGSC